MMAGSLGFGEEDLRRAAGGRSFERGREYVGQVGDLEIAGGEITASVLGGERYRVCLLVGEQGVNGGCSCPHGQDGNFCKHCVGVGLAVLAMGEGDLAEARAGWQSLESWLESLSKEELLAEVRRLLEGDVDLRRRLELRAAIVGGDSERVWRAVSELMTVPGYGPADDYVGRVDRAAAAIDDLIECGGAADAIDIAEDAIDMLAEAYGFLDDSSGLLSEAAYGLLAVHLDACREAPPDPEYLGRYLAGLLLDDRHQCGPNLAEYADLLGGPGLAAARSRITDAYRDDPGNWRAKSMMEALAKAEGDVDELVALYAADLDDRGRNHLLIARALDGADRGGEALGWAERGVREAGYPDSQLVEYLAGRYRDAGRAKDVLGLRRDRFDAERTLANYRALREAAGQEWPAERERALDRLREDARAVRGRGLWAWNGPVLVDALIDDGDTDAAWDAAADGATDEQWLRLADSCAATRPADALGVYLRMIGSLKTQTGDKVYRRIAALLLCARACHEALGTAEEFRRYLMLLRMECKRKRNLMTILNQNGL
jgi:hypothetical protein